MPRSTVNMKGDGCPKCGKDHFNAPYKPSRWLVDWNRPWRIQCRNCKQWFPTNDFAAYYKSALDKHGMFRLGKGDPQFLKPTLNGGNPEWVDDGTGIKIGGKKWFVTANYAIRVWMRMVDAARDLAEAYTLTNDPRYAHKAAVLLDRAADLYPDMNYEELYPLGVESSTGGSGHGRIHGRIWECFIVHRSRATPMTPSTMRWVEDRPLASFASGHVP